MDPEFLRNALIAYAILLVSLCVHEWAHAWTAWKLGDPTARNAGRVTFNPAAHIDPIGTVLLPLIMLFNPTSFGLVGWAKPVPVDSRYFRNPVRDDLLVTMAGPASNFVLAVLGAVVGGLLLRFHPEAAQLVFRFILINIVLGLFNLLPIPPLDGSHLLRHAFRMSTELYLKFAQFGFIILIVLINLPPFRQAFSSVIRACFLPLHQVARSIAGY